jgi:hypothetical protein
MPSDPAPKLYKDYFLPDSRGYQFLKNFHNKYYRELSNSEFKSFDAFLNEIFMNLGAIEFSKINGPEEHYVIKSMYYQCWNIIYYLKRERKFMIPDSATAITTDDGASESVIERKASDTPSPLETTEASDLFAWVNYFKLTLKREDLRILNALLDQKPLKDTAAAMNMDYNALCVKIKRLREKLALFLKRAGYQNDITQIFLKKNKKTL